MGAQPRSICTCMIAVPNVAGPPPPARVLVVDDHPDLRLALADTLAAEGYVVGQAEDGRQALELLAREPYDAAIVDVRMPLVDGFEVLEQMGERRLTCPVVLTSVVADASARRRGQSLGMFAFHEKPFALGELLADLERAVRRGRAMVAGGRDR
jgi:DNA-binding response OmpR family regulator